MFRKLAAILAIVSVFSCDRSLVKVDYKAIENGLWSKDEQVTFRFSGVDTVAAHQFYIGIRNDNSFPYNNLFLIADLETPDGKATRDTLEFTMADADGSWLGKGYGSIKENLLWYKENIVFASSGVYTLKISQAMRKNGAVNGIAQLEGITDVGFEIVQSEQ